MKNAYLSLLVLVFSSVTVFSQRANLDRAYFDVSYVKLPTKPIEDSAKRTFSANRNAILISGFTRVRTNGHLQVNHVFNGTTNGELDIKRTKKEKKDKNGNVTSVTYSYRIHVEYVSTGGFSVVNTVNPQDNYQTNYRERSNYVSQVFNSYNKASLYYRNNRYTIKRRYRNEHRSAMEAAINRYLNDTYGYEIKNHNDQFWILGSTKHPEFDNHKDLFSRAKSVFDKMNHAQPVDALRAEFEPIIQDFESIIPKYPGTKKREKKMRYASYYNIAQIYYYMDQPEKAKEYAQKLIDNDYDKSDGKRMIRSANSMIDKLKLNGMSSRHMEVITKNIANLPREKDDDPVVETKPVTKKTVSEAYLISKSNDTLLVNIRNKSIASIGYDIKVAVYDESGNIMGTKSIKADKSKELLFVDGTHYKNINFKEASGKKVESDATSIFSGASEKLCKVLYESDKIGLYIFNNKEIVFLQPGSEKGKSTMSPGFVFGFKKNLKKMAKGCPDLLEKVNDKQFKNNEQSLIQFCKELTSCK